MAYIFFFFLVFGYGQMLEVILTDWGREEFWKFIFKVSQYRNKLYYKHFLMFSASFNAEQTEVTKYIWTAYSCLQEGKKKST